jgi:hypothetical protein
MSFAKIAFRGRGSGRGQPGRAMTGEEGGIAGHIAHSPRAPGALQDGRKISKIAM